ncbi:MAG: ATP-binding protein, partial [Clostridia bacterium]|nr:ATP-binding protein [Clostridia bacterium]
MPRINLLPKEISELIAAGEVVERPASVVKELVENSIDAGAKHIILEIKRGGILYIRVTDDGCGIAYDDVPTAFLRHATSKIKSAGDLDRISSLG